MLGGFLTGWCTMQAPHLNKWECSASGRIKQNWRSRGSSFPSHGKGEFITVLGSGKREHSIIIKAEDVSFVVSCVWLLKSFMNIESN